MKRREENNQKIKEKTRKPLKEQRERINQTVRYKLAKYPSNMQITLTTLAFCTVFI
jgi:hypothetical protein